MIATMLFKVENQENYSIIETFTEKLDGNVSPNLKSELVVLNAKGVKNIILDFKSVRYCDSSGLSSILIANRLCKNLDGKLVLCNLQYGLKKLISISQLDSIITVSSTREDAQKLI